MKKRVVVALIIVVFALAAWKGKPLYQHLMAHRLLRSAEKANSRGDVHEAIRFYALAVKRAPNDLVILRRFAAILDRAHRPEVVQFRARISQLEPENADAVLDFVESALTYQDVKLARQIFAHSKNPELLKKARFHHLRSVLHFVSNELPQADSECEQAIKLEPGNDSFRVNQATIRLRAPNADARQNAIQVLDAIPKTSTSRFSALQSLLRYSTLVSNEPEKLNSWLGEFREIISPESPLFTIYLNALRRWQTDRFSAERDAYIKAALSAKETAFFAQRWLVESGFHDESAAFYRSLPLEWQTAPENLLLHADALFHLKKWELLKESLKSPGWNPIQPLKLAWEENVLRAETPAEAATEASLARWTALLASVGNNPAWLAKLTELAYRWQWKAEYERSLWALVEKAPSRAPEALESLSQFYLGTENGSGMLQVIKKQLSLHPDDPALQNNLAFLSFLLSVETNKAERLANDLAKRFPKAPSIIATAAFGKLKKGEFAEGLSLFTPLNVEKLRGTTDGVSYGLLLAAVGDRKAEEFLHDAEQWSHFPEERQLIKEALAKIQ